MVKSGTIYGFNVVEAVISLENIYVGYKTEKGGSYMSPF